MFNKALFLIIFTAALEAHNLHKKLPLLDGLIVGGHNVTIEDHPHQISLLRNGRHNCGGIIYKLRPAFIITAGHCANSNRNGLSVRVGSSQEGSGGKIVKVRKVILHEKYNGPKIDFDIALLQLEENLEPNERTKAIKLRRSRLEHGENATVTGWGTEKSGGSLQQQLQLVNVQIVENSVCDEAYGPNRITDRMICAGEKGKDACQGDSGGPLVINNELAGIVSWGKGCGVQGYPGVYGNVPEFYDWIVNNTKEFDGENNESI